MVQARGGFLYFIAFTDDYSRFGFVYLMKYKSKSFEKFKEFKNEVEKQFGKSIKTFRFDWGEEYSDQSFKHYLKEHGILIQRTSPRMSQMNGVSDRRNHTLLGMIRSMMSRASLLELFWGTRPINYLLHFKSSSNKNCSFYAIWNVER